MRSRRDGRWRRSRSSRLVRKGHIVRSKRTSVSMRSFRASPKENGRRWHHYASSHSTLNFKVETEHDPVIQIANFPLSVYGESKGPIVQNVFTLGGCLPIKGAQVISSNTEEDMLLTWRTFLHASDADIFTGYNVQNFDIPYLLDAAALWKKNDSELRIFTQWGRVKSCQTRKRETMFQSSAY
ncbi:hypothetical protein ACHAWU_001191, partial [Discostella pseudostelligera]